MKTLTVVFLLIFTSISLKCMDLNELAQIRANIIKNQPAPYDLSFIQKIVAIGKNQADKLSAVNYAIRYDIRIDGEKFYKRSRLLSESDSTYDIFTPEYSAYINPAKSTIILSKPHLVPFQDYLGLLQGYDFKSFLDVGHFTEDFNLDVRITKQNIKIEEVDYNWIPCYKIILEFYYAGQLQGGARLSKQTVSFIFDKKSFLLYEERYRKVNYDADENIEDSFGEKVFSYEYLTPKPAPASDIFDYKHLLNAGYSLVRK